jgi:hypothetical protein
MSASRPSSGHSDSPSRWNQRSCRAHSVSLSSTGQRFDLVSESGVAGAHAPIVVAAHASTASAACLKRCSLRRSGL